MWRVVQSLTQRYLAAVGGQSRACNVVNRLPVSDPPRRLERLSQLGRTLEFQVSCCSGLRIPGSDPFECFDHAARLKIKVASCGIASVLEVAGYEFLGVCFRMRDELHTRLATGRSCSCHPCGGYSSPPVDPQIRVGKDQATTPFDVEVIHKIETGDPSIAKLS